MGSGAMGSGATGSGATGSGATGSGATGSGATGGGATGSGATGGETDDAGAGGGSVAGEGGSSGEIGEGGRETGSGGEEPMGEAGAPTNGGGASNGGSGAGATGGSDATGGTATGGNDATGGTATGGSDATGGTATGGSDATGGTAAGGTSSGGTASGGTGGSQPNVGEECGACGAEECADVLARCDESVECSDWFDCVSSCADESCARACDEAHRDSVLLNTPIYECLCGACAEACETLDVCSQQCEEGAAPPVPTSTAATALSETGLYARAADGTWQLAPYVRPFRPEYVLFSDNAEKERFIYLPRCSTIDTRDMDHWSFPVGTRLWKQFTRDGIRIETRMLARYGTGIADWLMASYQWPLSASQGTPDPTQAVLAPTNGAKNVNGTAADIPSVSDCKFCHEKMTDRVLGFGAIQLSHSLGGLNFADLVDFGVLSDAPVPTGYDPPGDATAQAALGYLHANCGGCHNDTGIRVSLYLRLLVNQTSVESTSAYATAVNIPTVNANFPMDRIEPGDPDASAIIVRQLRNPSLGQTQQMPPVGRELVDEAGVAAVAAWISGMPH